MNLSPIFRLKLKYAFEDNLKFQDIASDEDYLKELFEWTDRGVIFICDYELEGHCIFISDTKGFGGDKTFKIINSQHNDVFLWHIDGVLYGKNSKCDCAFLAESCLGFVEFKANAANSTEASIKENYEKAESQLSNTYLDVSNRCQKIGIDLKTAMKVEAYAVFNKTVPRNNAYQKQVAAKFLLATNGIPLYFKNATKI